MGAHVFARVSGYGWTLLPVAPYRLVQVPGDPPTVVATHHHPDGDRSVSVRMHPPDLRWVRITAGTELPDVLDVFHGPDLDRWRIETSAFTCDWPPKFALQSTSDPFDLVGPDRELIWVRSPLADRVPPPEQFAAPGQTVLSVRRDDPFTFVEVGYEHDGEPWRQVHRLLPVADGRQVLIVTSQAPRTSAELAAAAGDDVFFSLRPFDGEW